jgi:hypothetical protein
MSSGRRPRTSEEMFDSLVNNAIDFLKRSVSELELTFCRFASGRPQV